MVKDELPFEVGQLAESKSFEDGFRGAWFRCKILDIKQKSGDISVQVDYYDYSDQKSTWIKVYQSPPFRRNGKKKKSLMVRPSFPTCYCKSDQPDDMTVLEVAVLVNNEWKVGDLVDWWTDGCYWSGTVTKILHDKKLQIELLPPPEGQGSTYEASSEDLRPSLNWSIGSGWSVPVPNTANGNSSPCAQILTPFTKGKLSGYITEVKRDNKDVATGRPMIGGSLTCSPPGAGKHASLEPSCSSDSVAAAAKTTTKDGSDNAVSSQKLNADYAIHLHTNSCDTLEATILDLEGLVNNVKRLEHILKFGVSYPEDGPSWKISKFQASPLGK